MYRLHVSQRSSLHNLCLRSCNRKQFSKEIDSSSSLLTCLIHGSIDIKLVLPLKSLPPEWVNSSVSRSSDLVCWVSVDLVKIFCISSKMNCYYSIIYLRDAGLRCFWVLFSLGILIVSCLVTRLSTFHDLESIDNHRMIFEEEMVCRTKHNPMVRTATWCCGCLGILRVSPGMVDKHLDSIIGLKLHPKISWKNKHMRWSQIWRYSPQ